MEDNKVKRGRQKEEKKERQKQKEEKKKYSASPNEVARKPSSEWRKGDKNVYDRSSLSKDKNLNSSCRDDNEKGKDN